VAEEDLAPYRKMAWRRHGGGGGRRSVRHMKLWRGALAAAHHLLFCAVYFCWHATFLDFGTGWVVATSFCSSLRAAG